MWTWSQSLIILHFLLYVFGLYISWHRYWYYIKVSPLWVVWSCVCMHMYMCICVYAHVCVYLLYKRVCVVRVHASLCTFSFLPAPSSLESSWSHCPLSVRYGSALCWNAEEVKAKERRWGNRESHAYIQGIACGMEVHTLNRRPNMDADRWFANDNYETVEFSAVTFSF